LAALAPSLKANWLGMCPSFKAASRARTCSQQNSAPQRAGGWCCQAGQASCVPAARPPPQRGASRCPPPPPHHRNVRCSHARQACRAPHGSVCARTASPPAGWQRAALTSSSVCALAMAALMAVSCSALGADDALPAAAAGSASASPSASMGSSRPSPGGGGGGGG
jgi:hypothetical protein